MNDQNATPEARIESALKNGPEITAGGRYGMLTRTARRLVGRAIAYERDYNNRINVALLEKVHQVQADAQRTNSQIEAQEASEASLHTVLDDLSGRIAALQTRLSEIDERTAVATSIASGSVSAAEQLTRELTHLRRAVEALTSRAEQHDVAIGNVVETSRVLAADAEKIQFVYDELTAQPYVAPGFEMRVTDARGRDHLGYRGAASGPLYVGFEDIFRGDAEFIEKRQRIYVDLLADRGRVVDLGCGRGELLSVLRRAGVEAEGVDLDEAMVERARAASDAPVRHGDALEFLSKQADGSLGAIFSAQFIEHLPSSLLPELLELSRAKLAPGGVFIAETVNPHSPRALKAFWVDPTHQHPLFPETMLALCRLTGFTRADIVFPLGGDDLDTNLRTCGEYAVSATVDDA
jgi:SAM-dependent methyltransferase